MLGRFINPDTLVPDPTDPQTLNRYSYVTNNPVNFTDPTGHASAGYLTVPDIYIYGTVPIQIPHAITGSFGQITAPITPQTFLPPLSGLQWSFSQVTQGTLTISPNGGWLIQANGPIRVYSAAGSSASARPPTPSRPSPPQVAASSPVRDYSQDAISSDVIFGNVDDLLPFADVAKFAGKGLFALGTVGAQVDFGRIFNAVRHLLTPGSREGIQVFHGGQSGLESLFLEAGQHGRLIDHPTYKGLFVDLGQGANVGFRESARHGPTMDVNIPGIDNIKRIHIPK